MQFARTSCPPASVLADFGLGKLDPASAETISQHLETCGDCRQRVASLSADSFVGRLRQAGPVAKGAVQRPQAHAPGESLARERGQDSGVGGRSRGQGSGFGGHVLAGESIANAANSTDGSMSPRQGGAKSPSSIAAPPELANHADYEILKELGQGGMGTVYLARNRMMDRLEVLKVISTALLDRPGAPDRFQQEIRSAAKLAHPNVVAAYRVLRPGNFLVFAMEYVRGHDLSEVVKQRGPLPVTNAAYYIHQVANGLQHAFEKGMVHRDIKPNNLMLAVEGKKHIVKILDFGLARANREKDALSGLTKSGQMLGTPDFIAPEQIVDARQADIRADIYSVGCTLYFLLSGNPPFQEASLYGVLEAHQKREARLLNLVRSDVPVELAAAVAKMMAKNPGKRYQTPNDVAKVLVPFFKPGQTAAAPPPDAPCNEEAHPQYTIETVERSLSATPARPGTPPPAAVAQPMLPAIQPAEPQTIVFTRKTSTAIRRNRPPWLAIAACAGVCVLILGVIVIIHNQTGKEVARVESQEDTRVETRQMETRPAQAPETPKAFPSSARSQSVNEQVPSETPFAASISPEVDASVSGTGPSSADSKPYFSTSGVDNSPSKPSDASHAVDPAKIFPTPTGPSPPDARGLAKTLARPANSTWDQVPLAQVVRDLRTNYRMNVVLDDWAFALANADPKKTLVRWNVRRGSLDLALRTMVEPGGLTWTIHHDGLWLTTKPAGAPWYWFLELAAYRTNATVRPRTSKQFIDSVETVDATTWASVGGWGTLKLGKGVLFVHQRSETQREIERRFGTQLRRINAPVASFPPSDAIRTALASTISLSLSGEPLQGVLRAIDEKCDVAILLKTKTLEEHNTDLSSPCYLELDRYSLGRALEALLKSHGLSYLVDGDVIVVTTDGDAASSVSAIEYNADAAVRVFGSIESVMTNIQSLVQPLTWDKVGGRGTMRALPDQDKLLIYQAYSVHADLHEFFALARASTGDKGENR